MKNKTPARRSKTAENMTAVAESVEENPGLSISRRSLELGILQTSLHRILHKYSGLKAHKVHLTQELKPADHPLIICGKCFRIVLSLEEVITIGHRDLVI